MSNALAEARATGIPLEANRDDDDDDAEEVVSCLAAAYNLSN